MTYSAGYRILASDYNGMVSNNASNVNGWWAAGSGNAGWGQSSLGTVTTGSKIYASAWASLVNTVKASSDHTGTTITSRTAPAKGTKISIFPGLITDITNIYSNRGNAVSSGTTGNTWTGTASYTSNLTVSNYNWSMIWTTTVTFGSADQARYFFNAGGLVKIDMSKTSTGKNKDTYWNNLVASIGTLYVSGGAQTVGGVGYTGFTRVGGSGSPTTYNNNFGWFYLLSYAGSQVAYQQNQTSGLYTGDYVRVVVTATSSSVLTISVEWNSPSLLLEDNSITGGTATTSPFSSFGTAPAVVVRCVNPSTTYLTNSWGTPTVAESVAVTTTAGPTINYLIVAGGGAGGSGYGNEGGGGGGAGGLLQGSGVSLTPGVSYPVVVGLGGKAVPGPGGGSYNTTSSGSNSSFNSLTAIGGGYGGGYTLAGATQVGASGGSGGGGNGAGSGHGGGAGTAGQGNDGGYGAHHSGGGGGGGAQYAGGSGNPGGGGSGLALNITGTYLTYAAGGNGGQYYGVVNGADASPNSGNGGTGGGGSNDVVFGYGGNGGSGVVIISYDSYIQLASGGTVTSYSGGTSGKIWVHKFTASGTFS